MMSNLSTQANNVDENTQVLIVGGSLIGPALALFLARQGISTLLVERHPDMDVHPRVASLTARTVEIFRSVGIEQAIRQVEPPFPQESRVPLAESLVGEEFDNLMEDMSAYFTELSPTKGSLISQDVCGPVLRATAEQAGADLRFATEMVDFTQDEEGVTATIRDRANGTIHRVRAKFLVAADGARSEIRQQLGIGQHGAGSLGHFMSMIFEADIMELFRKRHAVMCFLSNDTVSGTLSAYPGSSVRPDLFRLDIAYDPDGETVADYPEERCLPLIRAAAGLPDLQITFKTVAPWEMVARISDHFQEGRVFLVGDAARAQPPSGALGGNTGIAEAQNLAWKLAAVLRGEAGYGLLATYDAERRPLADYTVEQAALLSAQRATEGSEGITVNTLSINMGFHYSTGAVIQEDNANLPLVQPPDRWKGLPGTRAPHIVLIRQNKQISTLDLFGSHFFLLIGPEGYAWRDAAQRVAEQLNVPLDAYQIGGAELADVAGTFCTAYGITAVGAVLVRPDGIIAWRNQAAGEQPERSLAQTLARLLYRSTVL